MTKYKRYLWISLVLLLGGFLRLYQLHSLPVSLFGDEIDVGYQAWSLFTTSKDYFGHFLPTYIQSLTEWRAPLLMYVTAPFVGILGLNNFSIRLPSALLGILNIFLLFKLLRTLFPDTKTPFFFGKVTVAILAAFILAISPWHIHYSRGAFEVTLLLSLILSGTILFVTNRVGLSLIPFVLSAYTYSTASVFVPLFIICLYIIFRPKIKFKHETPPFLIAFVIAIPITLSILSGSATSRFGLISIFSDTKSIDTIVTARTEPWVIGRSSEVFFHNKPLLFVSTFASQYLNAFSTQFLFISGDPNFRHSVGEFGEIYLVLAPFFFIGFFSLISRSKDKGIKLILVWLILSPIPSAITQGGGSHATRLFLMLPPIVSMIAFGIYDTFTFLERFRLKTFGLVTLVAVSILSTVLYWHRYSDHYRFLSYKNWQFGYENVLTDIPQFSKNNRLFINNTYEPSLLKFLFYTGYQPARFQKNFINDVTKDNVIDNIPGFKLGENVYFVSPPANVDLSKVMRSGDLYVAVQGKEIPGDWDWTKNSPQDISVLKVSRDQFGFPLMYLLLRK